VCVWFARGWGRPSWRFANPRPGALQLENELLQEREEHRRRPCAYRSRTAATQNFTQLVGAPWRGGAGTLEAVQALAENISASFSEPSSVSSEHSPAGSGELPCSAQLARVHAVVRGLLDVGVGAGGGQPIGDEDGNVRALVLTLSELLDHGLIAFATAQRLALPAQAGSPSAWRVVRQSAPTLHQGSAQTVAFVCGLTTLREDCERLEGWLRLLLNEGSLSVALDSLLSDSQTLAQCRRAARRRAGGAGHSPKLPRSDACPPSPARAQRQQRRMRSHTRMRRWLRGTLYARRIARRR